jgi:hypothetical protein
MQMLMMSQQTRNVQLNEFVGPKGKHNTTTENRKRKKITDGPATTVVITKTAR